MRTSQPRVQTRRHLRKEPPVSQPKAPLYCFLSLTYCLLLGDQADDPMEIRRWVAAKVGKNEVLILWWNICLVKPSEPVEHDGPQVVSLRQAAVPVTQYEEQIVFVYLTVLVYIHARGNGRLWRWSELELYDKRSLHGL